MDLHFYLEYRRLQLINGYISARPVHGHVGLLIDGEYGQPLIQLPLGFLKSTRNRSTDWR